MQWSAPKLIAASKISFYKIVSFKTDIPSIIISIDMDLTFIDNNSVIDNKTRSVIRRQAAKGQNLGRRITRPSRVKAFERQALVQPLFAVKSRHESSDVYQDNRDEDYNPHGDIEDAPLRIEPVIGDSVSVLSLPIDVAQEDRVLMYEGELARHLSQQTP
jgi:hypothetical protein